MCDAIKGCGHQVTLYAKKPNSQTSPILFPLNEIYGIENTFKIVTYKALSMVRNINYDLSVLLQVLINRPNLVYTRSLRASYLCQYIKQNNVLELHSIPNTLFNKFMLKSLTRKKYLNFIVTISLSLKEKLLQQHPYLKENNIFVHHDAVDIQRLSLKTDMTTQTKSSLEIHSNSKIVLYVGHLYEGRGINIIHKLAKKLPHIHFLIVGGEQDDVSYQQSISLKMNIDNLTYTGFIPNNQLPQYYQAADILIMPYQRKVSVSGGGDTSTWMSPMKTFEYMASNKPIIASDLPALREVLNETNSILVEPDNIQDWKFAVENALTNYQMANKIALNALQDAQANTWQSRVTRILENYKV
tara:strand:+ start:18505 stop:19575 length:1071 start_codon:yes stop_codon:yes gene_type:complete